MLQHAPCSLCKRGHVRMLPDLYVAGWLGVPYVAELVAVSVAFAPGLVNFSISCFGCRNDMLGHHSWGLQALPCHGFRWLCRVQIQS